MANGPQNPFSTQWGIWKVSYQKESVPGHTSSGLVNTLTAMPLLPTAFATQTVDDYSVLLVHRNEWPWCVERQSSNMKSALLLWTFTKSVVVCSVSAETRTLDKSGTRGLCNFQRRTVNTYHLHIPLFICTTLQSPLSHWTVKSCSTTSVWKLGI
jgi:hypothetical protein